MRDTTARYIQVILGHCSTGYSNHGIDNATIEFHDFPNDVPPWIVREFSSHLSWHGNFQQQGIWLQTRKTTGQSWKPVSPIAGLAECSSLHIEKNVGWFIHPHIITKPFPLKTKYTPISSQGKITVYIYIHVYIYTYIYIYVKTWQSYAIVECSPRYWTYCRHCHQSGLERWVSTKNLPLSGSNCELERPNASKCH